jgi:hypothetical protein
VHLACQIWKRFGSNSEKPLNSSRSISRDESNPRKMEVDELERKSKALMISTAVVLAVLSAIAVMAYANNSTNVTGTTTDIESSWGHFGGHGPFGRHGRGCGPGGFVTVSQEFKDNVINIAKNDSDVQNLLTGGYNITDVRPIISSTVQGNGTVVTKATSAILMLEKDTTGRAEVWVDLEQAKVTRIVILTRTVIEKP